MFELMMYNYLRVYVYVSYVYVHVYCMRSCYVYRAATDVSTHSRRLVRPTRHRARPIPLGLSRVDS